MRSIKDHRTRSNVGIPKLKRSPSANKYFSNQCLFYGITALNYPLSKLSNNITDCQRNKIWAADVKENKRTRAGAVRKIEKNLGFRKCRKKKIEFWAAHEEI